MLRQFPCALAGGPIDAEGHCILCCTWSRKLRCCSTIILPRPKLCRLLEEMNALQLNYKYDRCGACSSAEWQTMLTKGQNSAPIYCSRHLDGWIAASVCSVSVLLGVVRLDFIASTWSPISEQALLLLRSSPAARGAAAGGDLGQKVIHAFLQLSSNLPRCP